MIDKVNINRLINQALTSENKVRKKEEVSETQSPRSGDVVNISQEAREVYSSEGLQDVSNKVAQIRDQIANGSYVVDADKIVEGFKKLFF